MSNFMTEDEYRDSEFCHVSDMWINFLQSAYEYLKVVHAAIQVIPPMVENVTDLGESVSNGVSGIDLKSRSFLTDARRAATREMRSEFQLTNALVLMAAWGAFESFIDDACLAVISHDRSVLKRVGLSKVKYSIDDFLQLDEGDLVERVFKDAVGGLGSVGPGVGKFESRLDLVGLKASVPKPIGDEIFRAQQDRNVWAHRGGIADRRYRSSSGAGHRVPGDKVKISRLEIEDYLLALSLYGYIVINRFREKYGLSRIPLTDPHPHRLRNAYFEMFPNPV